MMSLIKYLGPTCPITTTTTGKLLNNNTIPISRFIFARRFAVDNNNNNNKFSDIPLDDSFKLLHEQISSNLSRREEGGREKKSGLWDISNWSSGSNNDNNNNNNSNWSRASGGNNDNNNNNDWLSGDNNKFGGNSRGYNNDNNFGRRGYNNDNNFGRRDYNNNNNFGGRGGGFSSNSKTLPPKHWDTSKLKPIVKDFYRQHPDVANLPQQVKQEYLTAHGVTRGGPNTSTNTLPNPTLSFDVTSFPPEIISSLKENYSEPTVIQAVGWPVALSGVDMVGCSRTGSGKTLGFVLPAIAHIEAQLESLQKTELDGPIALVLVPTRELAIQIIEDTRKYLQKRGLRSMAVYGGNSKSHQSIELRRRPHLVVATPGRLIDVINSGYTHLNHCTYLVIDEADRLLDMGFQDQIESIIGHVRPDRQTTMWSATWPKGVQELANKYFNKALIVHVGSTDLAANPNVKQHIHVLQPMEKEQKLLSILRQPNVRALIFVEKQADTDYVCDMLQQAGIKRIAAIHGSKEQSVRERLLRRFRDNDISVLVSTAVVSRGLDINDITHVIVHDFPWAMEEYIHRIGRTGRAGKHGISHAFLTLDNNTVKLIPELIRILREAKQEVPQELINAQSSYGQFNNRRYGGGGGGGGRGSNFGGNRGFGNNNRNFDSFDRRGDRGNNRGFDRRGFEDDLESKYGGGRQNGRSSRDDDFDDFDFSDDDDSRGGRRR